ncbi:MAG TPA: TniB family NTP-binding protein [Desulfovibrio sp.]|uniref:TniB family NTP-binding protein n=1 Tax=Desulfovibrio sp. TaxID=885 RepID=UPI002D576EBB|nr:TniB family NTP-binding protein [Desulfovibrio sp.]HZF62021.1 TniB family NTP-binding protein [Desulfovibrio sp.]
MSTSYLLEDIFVAGGLPSVTYVERTTDDVNRSFIKSISQPNSIVSLTGPTKSGKTVLCRTILKDAPYIWVEGGQVSTEEAIWSKVCSILNFPITTTQSQRRQNSSSVETSIEGEGGIPLLGKLKAVFKVGGSQLSSNEMTRAYSIDTMLEALRYMQENKVRLVIDDFHYLPQDVRISFLRSIKSAIFDGLKIVLISVTHRAFEAIRSEPELTGRFIHVEIPEWNDSELLLIPKRGLETLNATCDSKIIRSLISESHKSPLLVQKFFWELCFNSGIMAYTSTTQNIPVNSDIEAIFRSVAKDSGEPIYTRLAAGPQTRTARQQRPLKNGGTADIYQAIFLAVAATGPKVKISYDELRGFLANILANKPPQRLEVSNALKHLAKIASGISQGDKPIDWDEEARILYIPDPFLRFFLRWRIK